MKAMGRIKVFHFNLEESKGHFILGRATKNSSKLARLATKCRS